MAFSPGLTSRWMAAARARESRRPDRLFDDPLSSALSGSGGFAWLEMMDLAAVPLGPGPNLYSVVRTRFFDEFLISAVSRVEAPQVVLLAAGMDARAFRLSWPVGTRVYELDLPEVLSVKEELLAHTGATPETLACERRPVGADLSRSSWLRRLAEAGHEAEKPTIWLAEGILLYLEEAEVRSVLDATAALSTPGSRLGADLVNRDMFLSPSGWPILEAFSWLGSPLRFGTNLPEALLAEYDWLARAVQPGEKGAHYGRWPYPVPPRGVSGLPRSFLLTAHRAADEA